MVRTLMLVGLIALGGVLMAGCNNCCEPNPCDPCANPCDPCAGGGAAAPAAAPADAPAAPAKGASCGGSGKG